MRITNSGHGRSTVLRTLAGGALTATVLAGCGLLGGDRSADEDWAHDAQSERYYPRDLLSQSEDQVREHFPALGDPDSVTMTEGRFTDPHGRAPLPGPDDYWWQAVIDLDAEQRDELIAQAVGTTGALEALEPVTPEAIEAVLVPTLEGELEDCAGGWVDVSPALAQSSGVSEAGDLLELTAVCVHGTQLVTSARDM